MTKFFAVLAGVSALALSTAAFAGGPIQLNDPQMDMVTAGGPGTAIVNLNAFAAGGAVTGTETTGSTFTNNIVSYGTGDSGSIGDSTTAIGTGTGAAVGTAVSGTEININTSAIGSTASASGSVISGGGSYPNTLLSVSTASLSLGATSP